MKNRNIFSRTILFWLLMLGSLTASGQITNGEKIKPVRRYVDGNDSFTVFTIKAERAIIYRLHGYKVLQGKYDTAVKLIEAYDSASYYCDTSLRIANSQVEILQETVSVKDSIIIKKDEVIAGKETEAKKFRRQRNLLAGVSIIAAVFIIIF